MNTVSKKLVSITVLATIFGGSLKCMESLPLDIARQITSLIMGTTLGYDFSVLKTIPTISNISSLAFSPDGKTVIAGSIDKTARLWDIKTGQQLHILRGHTDCIISVAYSPDGKTIITGSHDNTARLWDVTTGEQLHILQGHTQDIFSVAFSPDGKNVITGSLDTTARLWDISTGEQLQLLQGHTDCITSVAYSPDGKTVITGSNDTSARLWRQFDWNKENKELFIPYYPLLR